MLFRRRTDLCAADVSQNVPVAQQPLQTEETEVLLVSIFQCFWTADVDLHGLSGMGNRGMSLNFPRRRTGFASQNAQLRGLPLPKAHCGRTKEVLPCRVTASISPAAHPTDRSACPASPLDQPRQDQEQAGKPPHLNAARRQCKRSCQTVCGTAPSLQRPFAVRSQRSVEDGRCPASFAACSMTV